jgi:hypothetical protein
MAMLKCFFVKYEKYKDFPIQKIQKLKKYVLKLSCHTYYAFFGLFTQEGGFENPHVRPYNHDHIPINELQ